MKRSTIVEVISSLLILLFMYAAVSKLLDYHIFRIQLSKSPFITKFAPILAWALPLGEILVGLALTFKRTRMFGLYSSLFLMTMFTAYIWTMLQYSYYLPCNCGGILSKMTWMQHLWFNIGFVALSVIGIFMQASYLRSQAKKVNASESSDELPSVVYTAIS
jgi:putative Mn2+ efflux pump MntP